MSLLNKDYPFDKNDVKLLQAMMARFHEMHQGTGMPDYSNMYVGYLPVFAISLLASQEAVEKLTKKLIRLTWVLVFLTFVIAGLTIALILKGA